MKRNLLALTICSLIILILYRFPTGAGQMRYSMELAFRAVIAVILAGMAWRANKYVAAFLGLALLSQFYPRFSNDSARAFYNVMCGIILYYIIVTYGQDWTVQLMNMMCVIALANVCLVLLQVCNIHLVWKNSGTAITGLMENPNSLSALLALCFPAFLRGRQSNPPVITKITQPTSQNKLAGIKKIIRSVCFIVRSVASWKLLSPLVLFGLFASGSSGGLIAVMIGLCFYFIVTAKDRRMLYPISMGLAIIVGIFLVFFDTHQSCDIRLNVWSQAWALFTDHWLFGCGLGRWKTEFLYVVYYKGFPEGFVRLHSTILQTMLEMGIGFVIILAGYLINIGRRSWKNLLPLAIPLTAIIIIMVNGSVNFLIRIAPNAALAIVWLAIVELRLRSENLTRLRLEYLIDIGQKSWCSVGTKKGKTN